MNDRLDGALFGVPTRDLRITFVCYLVAHGGILIIPNAIYWDDWTLWKAGSAAILETFRQLGSPFNFFGYIHVAMMAVGPWAYRVLTFFLLYGAGLLVYRILSDRHRWISDEARLLIVILFLVSPFYAARIALVDFPYSLCLFLFFLGWFLMRRNRLAALACFILSFNMESLLVFYLLPVLEDLVLEKAFAGPRSLLVWSFRRLDFLAVPFIWFAVKVLFFKPFGLYQGYNEGFSARNLLKAPLLQAQDLLALSVPVFLVLIAAMVCAIAIKRFGMDWSAVQARASRNRYFGLGVLALAAGLFPYWILGDVPTFAEWTSRHQILMPLGTALLFLGVLGCCTDQMKPVLVSIWLGGFLAVNWHEYARDFLDWQKQKAIVNFLRHSQEAAAANLLIFEDATPNALSRVYRVYEWGGLIKLAYSGRSDKFGINSNQLGQYLKGDFDRYFSAYFNAEKHRRTCRDMLRVIIEGSSLAPVIHTAGAPEPSECAPESTGKETTLGG